MPTYDVRVKCEDESSPGAPSYKRINQSTIDENWIPTGCESHSIVDFVIEKEIA